MFNIVHCQKFDIGSTQELLYYTQQMESDQHRFA
jgi:hypothetical protein